MRNLIEEFVKKVYMDKEHTFDGLISKKYVIRTINKLAEEHNINDFVNKADISKKESPWISVKKKLPAEKENELTRDYFVYPVMVDIYGNIDIRYYSYGNGHWYHGFAVMDEYVTHWMDIKPLKTEVVQNEHVHQKKQISN